MTDFELGNPEENDFRLNPLNRKTVYGMESTGREGCFACTHLDGGIFCENRRPCLKLRDGIRRPCPVCGQAVVMNGLVLDVHWADPEAEVRVECGGSHQSPDVPS